MNSTAVSEIKGSKYYSFIVVIAALIFFICQYQKIGYSPDDTYIYLKYSKNISEGYNFSFNKGEPSYGVTGPLWALILVIPFWLGIDPFWFAKFLDLFFILVSFFIFFKFTLYFFKDNIIFRVCAVSLFILNPLIIRSTFTGMETSFAVFIALLSFYLFYSEKLYWSFIVMGFGMLLRPEVFILIAVLGATLIIRNFRERKEFYASAKIILCALLIVVPYWIFAYITFGTIISNTSLGKSVLRFDIMNQLANAWQIIRLYFFFGPAEVILFAVGSLFLILRKKYQLLPLILWAAGLLTLYIVSSSAVMSRYLVIIYPFTVIVALKSIESIPSFKRVIVVLLIAVCLFYSQLVFYKHVKPYSEGFTAGINECLIPAGKWIESNVPDGNKVLVNDVGAIGFYTNKYIIDAAALINRDLELNRKILSVPNIEKENPHLMLDFIPTDYLVEKDTAANFETRIVSNFELVPLKSFVFRQMWVLDPRPQYFTIYKVNRVNPK